MITHGKSPLFESLQIFITLSGVVLLMFLQSVVEKLLAWLGLNPTTLDLSSQLGALDHLAMATP